MPKIKSSSPARSHGSIAKSRRNKHRLSRSVCSPDPSTASGRLTTVLDQFTDRNMNSFALSPLSSRLSILTDKTDIEETHRKSWWKNLNENSGNIMEALGNEVTDSNNTFEKLVEIDGISQEKSNIDFELSDSSIDESVKSIVLSQRKLFHQIEKGSQQNFGQIVGVRENFVKLHNTSTKQHDKTIIAGTKNFFQNTQKSKQVFPAALLNLSHNKTVDQTKENIATSTSESKGVTKNIFAGRINNKTKNIFANFILTESDDEVLDIQPKVFGFQKQAEMQPLIWQDQNSSDEFEDEVEQVQTENNRENISQHKEQCNISDLENIVPEVSNEIQEKGADENYQQTNEDYKTKHDTNEVNVNQDEDQGIESATDINQENKKANKINGNIGDIDDDNFENHEIIHEENGVDEICINQKQNIGKNHYNNPNVDTERNGNKSKTNEIRYEGKEINNGSILINVNRSQEIDNKWEKNNCIEKVNNKTNIHLEKSISQEPGPVQGDLHQNQANNIEDSQTQATNDELKWLDNLNMHNIGKENDKISNEKDKIKQSQTCNNEVNESQKVDNKLKDSENFKKANFDNDNCPKENVRQEQPGELNEVNGSETDDSKCHHSHENNQSMANNDNENSSEQNVTQLQHRQVEQDEENKSQSDDKVNQSYETGNELDSVDTDNNETNNSSKKNISQEQDMEEVKANQQQNNSSKENISQEQDIEEVEANQSQLDDVEVDAMDNELEESENQDEEGSEHESVDSENIVKSDSSRNDSEAEKGQDNGTKSKVDISHDIDSEHYLDESIHVDDVNDEVHEQNQEEMDVDDDTGKEISNIQDEEIVEASSNITRKPTSSKKNNMPEVVLDGNISPQESFIAKACNESFRKSKSINNLAPAKESLKSADGTGSSSVEGSAWDSHRTTRKTLRQTFGRDFTPRKSLRALVMEKSANLKKHLETLHSESVMLPQANSTEYPDVSNHEVDTTIESDHEESRRARLAVLDEKLQKIRQKNLEKKAKLEEEAKNRYKARTARNVQSLFKIPVRPPPRKITTTTKPKKQSTTCIFGELSPEVIEDMKYKPPKRFKPSNASWITKRLYKFLENKLEPKYDYRSRVRAEKLVETIYHFTKDLRRQKVASIDSVKMLKHEFARLNIVKSHFEFYDFFHEFMPREVRVKVVPDLVNKIALPQQGIFSDIL